MPEKQKAKSSFVRGFKKSAEEHSVNFRRTLGLRPEEHLPARLLAEHLKVPIFCPTEINGMDEKHLQVLLKPKKSKWSAVTVLTEDDSKIILYNSSHPPTRQESDLMHELAHVICGHEMRAFDQQRANFPFIMREFNKSQEDEANWLGGCLQMPRVGLVWARSKGMSIDEMAEHFNASRAMVTFRVNKEGINRQFGYRR